MTLRSPDILYPLNPGTKVADLTLSGTLSTGANTFNAPADTELSTGTYFVVVERPQATGVSLSLGEGNVPETTALTGWSIADNLRYSLSGASWSNWPTPFSMAVKGIGTTTTNTAATGQPAITGTAQVGQMLTASTSGIMDADLLPASFTYQWVRVGADGTSNETNIGSNLSTYTPSSSDVGNRIRVKVSFTDGAGNAEGPLPSDAYPSEPPGATVVAAQGSCPSDNDWCAMLTMGYDSSSSRQSHTYDFGFISGSNFGVLAPAMFTRGPTAYTFTEVSRILNTTPNGNTILSDSLSLGVSGGTLPDGTVLNVGGTELTVGTDTATSEPGREQWDLKALGISFAWVEGQKVSVSLKFPTPPVLLRAYTGFFGGVGGLHLRVILEFDKNLDVTAGGLPPVSSFTIVATGDTLPLENVMASGDRGVRIDLKYSNNFIFRAGEQITVSYVDPTSGDDDAGPARLQWTRRRLLHGHLRHQQLRSPSRDARFATTQSRGDREREDEHQPRLGPPGEKRRLSHHRLLRAAWCFRHWPLGRRFR